MYIIKNKQIYDLKGKRIHSNTIKKQIKNIYVPPGYKNVVYVLKKDLLAIGTDKLGRKQYIYSQNHIEKRNSKRSNIIKKVNHCIQKIEKKIKYDLLSKNYLLHECALAVSLILLCNFRIGTKSYAKQYKHYGITTLLHKHLKFSTNKLIIEFIGKKGVLNTCIIKDSNIIKYLKKLHKNKSSQLFHITSSDVNEYLRPFHITCKELRTWNANKIFIECIHKYPQENTKNILKIVASHLHNTPTVCKKSYLMKSITDDSYVKKIKSYKTKNPLKILHSLL